MDLPKIREPAWVTAAADQRVTRLREAMSKTMVDEFDMVQAALTDPPTEEMKAYVTWDNSCDNCGAFCPGTLICKTVIRSIENTPVLLMAGGCAKCWDLE